MSEIKVDARGAREFETFTAATLIDERKPSDAASTELLDQLRREVHDAGYVFAESTVSLELDRDATDLPAHHVRMVAIAKVVRASQVPGAVDGPPGPFSPANRSTPHVYAREVHSGAGNCRCGRPLGDWVHTEAAPGVPIPEAMRHGR